MVDEIRDPAPVLDHHVPVLTGLEEAFNQEQWDLTTHQILPHMDGYTHVLKIACKAEVHPDLVKDCIQNLVNIKYKLFNCIMPQFVNKIMCLIILGVLQGGDNNSSIPILQRLYAYEKITEIGYG